MQAANADSQQAWQDADSAVTLVPIGNATLVVSQCVYAFPFLQKVTVACTVCESLCVQVYTCTPPPPRRSLWYALFVDHCVSRCLRAPPPPPPVGHCGVHCSGIIVCPGVQARLPCAAHQLRAAGGCPGQATAQPHPLARHRGGRGTQVGVPTMCLCSGF
jgi:hypothetical protein